MNATITPQKLCGSVPAVCSKSFAHRALIASALFCDKASVFGVTPSADISATIQCLNALGADISAIECYTVTAPKRFNSTATLDCLESGSTLRFLLPIAAALGVDATFVGSQRLLQRPNEQLLEVLSAGGVTVEQDDLHIHLRGKLHSGNYTIPANVSSQYITGLLFALSVAEGDSTLHTYGKVVSKQYIDITLDVLRSFGAQIEVQDNTYLISGGRLGMSGHFTYNVEGDWSNAAFPLVAGALGGDVTVTGLNLTSCQGDKEILSVLQQAGAEITLSVSSNVAGGSINAEIDGSRNIPFNGFDGLLQKNADINTHLRSDNAHFNSLYGSVRVRAGKLQSFKVNAEDIPDAVPAMSVLAAYARGTSEIFGVERLRLKESDRLKEVIAMLSSAGISAMVSNDTLRIVGGKPRGAHFNAANDHRMAMSETILALYAQGTSTISGAECVGKSYPTFFDDVVLLGGQCVSLER